jgi:hypothetical protein
VPTTRPARRPPFGVFLLALLAAFSFGAIVRTAFAVDYHTTCVGHGFVSGSDPSDGSFFSRVETGCSSTYRTCDIYTGGVWQGGQTTPNSNTTCNAWSRDFGSLSECNSTAHVYNQGVFSAHVHTPNNYCG